MGIMVYSLFWVMQDLYHQPYPDHKLPELPVAATFLMLKLCHDLFEMRTTPELHAVVNRAITVLLRRDVML